MHSNERSVISLKERRTDLAALFAKHSDHWRFEDPVYRFYHQSFKVFVLQSQTQEIVGNGHRGERNWADVHDGRQHTVARGHPPYP